MRFTIASGLPDQAHFTLILPQVNFSSFNTSSSATVTVAAGDTFSNPAQSGTSVYFSTNVGIIGASGTLDGLGNTSVTWAYGLNPQPPSNGIAFVNARTLNRWGKFVQATDTVIFSFGPIIDTLTGPFLNFQIPHGFSQSFTFRVADKNGNPLSKGTTIAVQASGAAAPQVLLSGDVNNILSDTKNAGVGSTIFTVTVSDTTTGTGQGPKPLILTFIVTGPNTSGPVSRSFSGTLQGSSSSGAGKVAQVAVVNPAIDSLTVTGGGGVSSEPIQFQVLDFYSNPIPNVQVQFAISQSVGGGEYFNPTIATSDVNGKVQTTLFAGIRSGLVQVVAKALTVVSNSKSVYIRTGIISSIAIINVSSSSLSVQGVGGNGTSTIVFEGRDSLGNPIDASNSAPIKFTLQGDTSSRVSPLVAKTDPVTGRATTSFTSGIKSGLAYVTASARGDSVKSSPVQFTISGGFPDSTHFSIGPVKLNIAGGAIFGLTDQINLVVGDEYGNPAQPGSVVFFNTTGGIIQASSSLLSDGTASATLTSGNPEPPNGLAIITAQVGASSASAKMGKVARSVPLASRASNTSSTKTAAQSQSFTRSTGVLFSGRTQIASANNNFIIPVGSSTAVNYIVSDSLGNPLVSGTTIQVALSGSGSSNIAMTGDASVNLPDTQDKRYTLFQVSLKDTRTTGLNLSQAVTLTISVNSPNGINKLILTGNLSGTGGITVDSTIVSRIVLQNPSPDSIMVAGVGGVNTDNVKFKVYNTFGLPDKNILVTFNMPQSLGGGEYLSPASALTDTGGNVSTTLTSGTKFGEVLVTASTTEDSISLSSNPKVIYIVIPPSARLASQVLYLGATATDIYVDGVGAIENSTISYQVTDSLGIPIDRQRRVGVTYAVQFFPNSSIAGGTPPSVIPSTDSTDDNGQLHTSVVSGTEAGVIQVVAHINVPGRPTLISQPVKITIHAGFADQAHFTLMPSAYGVAGLNNFIPFTVAVGDTFSNPVAVGTAIYFHSQAGIIQTGSADFSAYTNTTGEAGVSLLLVNPRPLAGTPYEYKPGIGSGLRYADAAHINGRDGYFWVYAQTQGHNATNVIDSALMVWGVGPITVTGLPASVTVSNVTNTSPPISIRVTDGNLNPLPDGTTITASIEPIASPPTGFQVGVSGGISTNFYSTIPYTQNSIFYGTNITDYTFNVVNESVPSNTATGVTVTVVITINAPNIGTASFSFTATMQ